MPGIEELKVSLTKNGYFKVADIIIEHPLNEVLDNLGGLDRAQIVNMLVGDQESGRLPEFWNDVKGKPKSLNSLLFISIIFSHHKLIQVFAESNIAEMSGIIKRENIRKIFNSTHDKVYTNLVDTMERAGLCVVTRASPETRYSFEPLFRDMSIGPLAKNIFYRRLEQTGWKEPSTNDYFTRNFYEQCFFYEFNKTLGISETQFEEWLEGRTVEIEEPPKIIVPDNEVSISASLLTSLRTKPFVILAGTTGTGKTRIIRHFVHNICPVGADKTFNHVFIPVEAGWTDARHLLGYKNPFGKNGETYCTTPLISLLLRANYNGYEKIPFFIILDEMNLSYVEKYFSKFLSLIEVSNEDHAEPIIHIEDLELLLKSEVSSLVEAKYIESAIEKGGLFLTSNVFIVGTVNVDETTHMFSPKVLDRAFVHEYVTIKPSDTSDDFSLQEEDKITGKIDSIYKTLLSKDTSVSSNDINDFLDEVYSNLEKFKFGPRVTNECRSYYASVKYIKDMFDGRPEPFYEESSIRDKILMQKILPKLHGNKGQLSSVIGNLLTFAKENNLQQSSDKLKSMEKDLLFPGFTNYF